MSSPISRYKDAAEWTQRNLVLRNQEYGIEEDTGKVKRGDGTTKWNSLPYLDVPAFTLPQSPTSTYPSQAEMKTLFASPSLRSGHLRAIAIGDSTTMGDSGHPGGWLFNVGPQAGQLSDGSYPPVGPFEYRHGPRSWFEHACWQSKGRLRPIFNAGQGSASSDTQLRRFGVDVLAKKPDLLFIGDAHNDGSIGEAQSRLNILTMIDQAQAAGIRVVLTTSFPSDTTATSARLRRHNTWLKMIAQQRGLLISDKYAALVDPTDGTYLSTMQQDGTHSSYIGAAAAGARVLADLAPLLGSTSALEWLPSDNIQDTNLLTNGLLLTTGSFTPNSGAGALTYETDATKFMGRAAVSVFTGAGRVSQDITMATRGISVGDRLKWVGLARVRNAVSGNMRWAIEMTIPGGNWPVRPVEITASGMDMPEFFYYEAEMTVPAAATIVRVGANVTSGTGEISLAQQAVYNLTTLAIAA